MTQDIAAHKLHQEPVSTEQSTLFSPFDRTRHVRDGIDYWSARESMPLLGYRRWEHVSGVVERGRMACKNSGYDPEEHFRGATKLIVAGKGAQRQLEDYEFTRYAMYLVAMNGDPRKPEIAMAQTYFALQTRQAELAAIEGQQRLLTRLVLVEGQLQEIQQGRIEARTQLQYIERSERSAPEKPLRARLNELVRLYCQTNTESYAGVWNMLYKELYYRCHTDVRARAKKNNLLPLDEADRAGLLENLYAIASEILV